MSKVESIQSSESLDSISDVELDNAKSKGTGNSPDTKSSDQRLVSDKRLVSSNQL